MAASVLRGGLIRNTSHHHPCSGVVVCHAKPNKITSLAVNAPIWVWVSTVTGTDWSEGFGVNVMVVLQELESGLAVGEVGKLRQPVRGR